MGRGVIAIQGLLNQFFTDFIPENPVVGWIYFPGILLYTNTLLINRFYNHIGQVLLVSTTDPVKGEFIDRPDKFGTILAQQKDRPLVDIFNDAGISLDWLHNDKNMVRLKQIRLWWAAYGVSASHLCTPASLVCRFGTPMK